MDWTVSQSLVLIAVIEEIGLLDFVKIADSLNSIFSTNIFEPEFCELEYRRISHQSNDKDIPIKECIKTLNKERIAQIKQLLNSGTEITMPETTPTIKIPQSTTKKEKEVKKEEMESNSTLQFIKSLPNQVSAFAQGVIQGFTSRRPILDTEIQKFSPDKLDLEDEVMMDIIETPRKSSRISNVDEKYKKWKSTSLLVFDKMTDHRNGNVFLRKIKGDDYEDKIKIPMYLDLVKSRIRDGTIKTTAEFHRDLTLICANAIMYNQEGSDIYNMTLEFKEFIDSELQNLLIDT